MAKSKEPESLRTGKRVFQSAYLGFYGGALYVGQGLMREGVGLLLKHAYSPGYLKICGRWRDHERWAKLAEDRLG